MPDHKYNPNLTQKSLHNLIITQSPFATQSPILLLLVVLDYPNDDLFQVNGVIQITMSS